MSARRLLIHVQHLLGIGHLKRAAIVARACAGRGMRVTLASGGPPVDGLDLGDAALVQLPQLSSRDETFATLVDENGRRVGNKWCDRRRDRLLALFAELRPHVVVIELFPFGRRRLGFELLPLLEAARVASPRPWIASSVRDVLTARHPRRSAEAARWAQQYFDAVLVHGDPTVIRFEESFPAAEAIADKFAYTGYVAGPAARRGGFRSPGWNEVIVSAGGGAVGEALLRTALEARPFSRSAGDLTWRLLTGANLAEESFAALAAAAPEGIVVERTRSDLARLLANCAVSVSQGGYNTVVDVLRACARAVIVPFSRARETEQGFRAARLEALGLARCVDEGDLTPARLVAAVDAALAGPRPRPAAVALDGAERSATVIAGWAQRVDD
ncbi:MAG: glycosyltransferase family protein [Alphaproteobacteria bacterium]